MVNISLRPIAVAATYKVIIKAASSKNACIEAKGSCKEFSFISLNSAQETTPLAVRSPKNNNTITINPRMPVSGRQPGLSWFYSCCTELLR